MDSESLQELTESELLARVKRLVRSERQATAALVAHLAEIENRKLYLEEGCGSLFSYCTQVLHLSEHAAYNRIEAARAARRFPLVLASLAHGDVHLAAVKLLAPHLTPENHRDLLAAAKNKSKRAIEELIARLRPQPDVPAVIRKMPAGKRVGAATMAMATAQPGEAPAAKDALPSAKAASSPAASPPGAAASPALEPSAPPRPATVVPLAPERYKVQFTATAATCDKLRRAQELLRYRIPAGDVAEIFDMALDLLVRDLESKKFAATDRPRPGGPGNVRLSRHIAAEVKRAVWQRDQGRCAFVSASGARCTERGQLEFDHIQPHADGGGGTVDNVRLLCRRHNQYAAQQFFGLWHAEGVPEPVER